MALVLKELNPKGFKTTEEIDKNLVELLEKMNKVRALWNKPMTVTSGFRSKEDHLRIYKEQAEKAGKVFDEKKVPMGSKHLYGQACDISDPDGKLFDWCKENEAKLAEIGLWMEEKDSQKRVHFQIIAPKSGNRFFKP